MRISLNFFLLLCFSESIYAVSALSPDGLALMSLLTHWTSVPSSIKLSWHASDSNPCSWVGVQCDYRKLNVVGLNLSSYEISGQLGPEFASLKQLKSVDFSNNFFSDSNWAVVAFSNIWICPSTVLPENYRKALEAYKTCVSLTFILII
ncbi:hypothetical protein RJ639_034788 [Escallonia herrerae]|uniref:Leucine-rich repeat-containing N-terminal plant-type domain-containing protein n=1 Tax=Escallonia herrerae TaxID=1293975 RepID=A0AA88WWN3_9ASTE|nr:hypothetical protein RJ639_034788 [Escallonia herrerae]